MKTVIIQCKLPYHQAEAFNRESARIYNNVMINHWRIYRKKSHWLSRHAAERLDDYLGGPTFLHSHSRDAAQQGFYRACTTVKRLRERGYPKVKYPYKQKTQRTTVWKNTAIRIKNNTLLLSNAKKTILIKIKLPTNLKNYQAKQIKEVRLVKQSFSQAYQWHIIIAAQKTAPPPPPSTNNIIAIDLGQIHPATATDGKIAVVFCARALRSIHRYINKRLGELNDIQTGMKKGSQRWSKIEQRKRKFLIKQQCCIYDIEHKISRAVIDWAIERKANKIVIGDRPVFINGKVIVPTRYLNKQLHQKLIQKSVSHFYHCLYYKAKAVGINVTRVNETYSSQICPQCGHKYKPRGRIYTCTNCNFIGHRDVVAASNILSKVLYGCFSKVLPHSTEYRHPFLIKTPLN